MSLKCLLCGHVGEKESCSDALPCCSWCKEEAKELHPKEVSALLKLDQIKPYFSIWNKGRREDSSESKCDCTPEPQPAKVFPGLELYIGDMDDAADTQHLIELGVGCIVNLCADKISKPGYEHIPLELARAGIHQHILVADDSRNFDIVTVAEHAYGAIDAALKMSSEKNGVLIHCWGGVNRSAAVLVAYLTLRCGVPLFAAVDHAMRKRGTILTNQSFRKQLVRLCFRYDLKLEDDCVPPALMVASAKNVVDVQTDMTCNDPEKEHRQSVPRDTPIYGLLYAARDGCLTCVKQYIEVDGVDYNSCSATRGYTAEDWARWELEQSYKIHKNQKRKRCEAVLAYLATCAKSSP